MGEHFLIYRTKTNKVHVTEAYCPHLGADLGIGGQVVDDNIVCPFHLWEFNGEDGQCTKVPYSKTGMFSKILFIFFFILNRQALFFTKTSFFII